MSLRKFLDELTSLNRSEQRGVLVLATLLLILAIVRWAHPYPGNQIPVLTEEEARMVRDFLLTQPSGTNAERANGGMQESKQTAEQGAKGTSGRKPQQTPARGLRQTSGQASQNPPQPIELNQADSMSLVRLPGIGPVLSSRILKYRRLLGGFASVDQLREVYGLRSGLVDTLSWRLRADSAQVQRIDLNHAGFPELRRHPYIGTHLARSILRFREHRGLLSAPEELVQQKVLTREEYQRIRPYLSATP